MPGFHLTYCKAIFCVHNGNTLTCSRRVTLLPFHLRLAIYAASNGERIRNFRTHTLLPCYRTITTDPKRDVQFAGHVEKNGCHKLPMKLVQ
jgi:hypothetical protein